MTIKYDAAEVLESLFSNCACFGPVSNESIANAERELGLSFPNSYRIFLLRFGATHGIAGLPNTRCTDAEPPEWPNVIDETAMLRRASRGNIPFAYISIASDGADIKYYLDTGTSSIDGECHVIALGPGFDGVKVAASFVEFAGKYLRDDLVGR